MFKNVKFERSISMSEQFNHLLKDFNQIGIIGRSNVGKSSLINALTNNSKLAKTSSKPGKTTTLNYFNIDDTFYLVDLPGYGYSKRSKEFHKNWEGIMNEFMLENDRLKHIILIIDFKVGPTDKDIEMIEYLTHYNIPYSIIASKYDKIIISKRVRRKKELIEMFDGIDFIAYSSIKKINIDLIEKMMFRLAQ